MSNSKHWSAKERIEYIFDEFEHICISFSGGKDSTATADVVVTGSDVT